MGQDSLSNLAILSIEHAFSREIDIENVICNWNEVIYFGRNQIEK